MPQSPGTANTLHCWAISPALVVFISSFDRQVLINLRYHFVVVKSFPPWEITKSLEMLVQFQLLNKDIPKKKKKTLTGEEHV